MILNVTLIRKFRKKKMLSSSLEVTPHKICDKHSQWKLLAQEMSFLPDLQPPGPRSCQTSIDTTLCSTTGHTQMVKCCNPVVLPTHHLPPASLWWLSSFLYLGVEKHSWWRKLVKCKDLYSAYTHVEKFCHLNIKIPQLSLKLIWQCIIISTIH